MNIGLHPEEVPNLLYNEFIVTIVKLRILACYIRKRTLKIIRLLLKNKKLLFIKVRYAATTETEVDSKFKGHIHSEGFAIRFGLTT